MEITMKDIINLAVPFNKLLGAQLPVKTAYKVAKIKKKVDEEIAVYEDFYREALQKYGAKDKNGQPKISEDGTQYLLEEGKEEEFKNRILEIQNIVVDLNEPKISIVEIESLNFAPMELVALLPLIEEEG